MQKVKYGNRVISFNYFNNNSWQFAGLPVQPFQTEATFSIMRCWKVVIPSKMASLSSVTERSVYFRQTPSIVTYILRHAMQTRTLPWIQTMSLGSSCYLWRISTLSASGVVPEGPAVTRRPCALCCCVQWYIISEVYSHPGRVTFHWQLSFQWVMDFCCSLH